MQQRTDEAERTVLGSILATSGKALDEVELRGEDFHDPARGDLFDEMRTMWGRGVPVDAFTLSEKRPEQTAFLYEVTSDAVPMGSLPYYADAVKKSGLMRRISNLSGVFATLDPAMDSTALADMCRQLVEDAIGHEAKKTRFVADILPDLVEKMKQVGGVFVPSPWPSLDNVIGGFRPGCVYVIAARPGMGKTLVAGQVATQLANFGNVAFSSLEMTEDELVARFVAERMLINVGHVKDARMTDADWDKFNAQYEELAKLRIAINDQPEVSSSDVRVHARSVARNGKLAGIVVDYLQLMTSGRKVESRQQEVSEFSRQLKILAKKMQVPVIALSQLNRDSEKRMDRKPSLADLRESGAIEQDADAVFLLRREGEFPSESLVIDVAKNRHGETGEVTLAWDGTHSRAVEWSDQGTAGGGW